MFKLNYYYKFIGKIDDNWSKNFIKYYCDGKWHKCVEISESSGRFKKENWIYWPWNRYDFQESKYHPVKRLLEEL
jgi:hypothetical protein